MPVANLTLFNQLLGPISTTAAVNAYVNPENTHAPAYFVGNGAGWVSKRNQGWDYFATLYGSNGNGQPDSDFLASLYYDRPNVGYRKYAMDGYSDESLLTLTNALAVHYRNWLVNDSNGNAQAHWQLLRGLALHYAATGDTVSRDAVRNQADYNILSSWWSHIGSVWGSGGFGDTTSAYDQRIWARAGESTRLAIQLGVTSGFGYNFTTKAAEWLAMILARSGQYSDGAFRDNSSQKCTHIGDGGVNSGGFFVDPPSFNESIIYRKPFYSGILLNELIQHHRVVNQSPALLTAITNACENLFTGPPSEPGLLPLFIPGPDMFGQYNAFAYHEAPGCCGFSNKAPGVPNAPGDPYHYVEAENSADNYCAPSLNGLTIAPFAFLYGATGNSIWKTRFNKLLDGLGSTENIYGLVGKTYSEMFSYSSGDMWPMILNTPVVDPPVVPRTWAMALRCRS